MLTPNEKILYIGDNLPIMLGMESDSVDLIYTDPPFKTETFRQGKTEKHSFNDTWSDYQVDYAHAVALKFQYPEIWQMICLAGKMHSPAMQHYLEFMAPRMVQMHRLLKPTGSLYLHCDQNADYYLRMLLDGIFGKNNFRNEIIWHYGGTGSPKRFFPQKHDVIFFYAKGEMNSYQPIFVSAKKTSGWTGSNEKRADSVWRINTVFQSAQRKYATGYDTEKPLELVERIVRASSKAGDLVMDPFCGCATACMAAGALKRRWIGIDQNEASIQILSDRMSENYYTAEFETNKPVDAKPQQPIALPKRKVTGYVRMAKSNAKPILAERDLHNYGYTFCQGCCDRLHAKHLEVGHILAKDNGGLDELENYQLLCGNCNHKNGNRDMEFLYGKLDAEKLQCA